MGHGHTLVGSSCLEKGSAWGVPACCLRVKKGLPESRKDAVGWEQPWSVTPRTAREGSSHSLRSRTDSSLCSTEHIFPGVLHRLQLISHLLDQSHLRRGRYHLISTQTYLKYAAMNSPRSFKSNPCDLCMFLP